MFIDLIDNFNQAPLYIFLKDSKYSDLEEWTLQLIFQPQRLVASKIWSR